MGDYVDRRNDSVPEYEQYRGTGEHSSKVIMKYVISFDILIRSYINSI